LLGGAIDERLHELPYDERLLRLAERRIGLWDVIATATRPGSLDQSIRLAEHNRVQHLLHDFPELRAIAFNGTMAAGIGRRLIGEPPLAIALLDLPSSSAANTRPLAEKAGIWSELRQFLQP
jgi:double-stranded uracil-DNA glycosylase